MLRRKQQGERITFPTVARLPAFRSSSPFPLINKAAERHPGRRMKEKEEGERGAGEYSALRWPAFFFSVSDRLEKADRREQQEMKKKEKEGGRER